MTALTPGTAYDIYVVAEDSAGNAQTSAMKVDISTLLPNGSYVKFGTYNGVPIIWRVIAEEAGKPLLMADKRSALKRSTPKATTPTPEAERNRIAGGSNFWEKSNLREWLNSTATTGVVTYTHATPTAGAVQFNAYATEAGFLNGFAGTEIAKIANRTAKSMLSTTDVAIKTGGNAPHNFVTSIALAVDNYENANYKDATDKVFVLSVNELSSYVNGNGLEVKRMPTKEAVSHSIVASGLNTTTYWPYWLRDAFSGNSNGVRIASQDGNVGRITANFGRMGVVPAIQLTDKSFVSGSGTLNDPFIVIGGIFGADPGASLAQVTRATISANITTWAAVATCDAYEIELYRDGTLVTTVSAISTATSYDFTSVIATQMSATTTPGIYFYNARVRAKSSGAPLDGAYFKLHRQPANKKGTDSNIATMGRLHSHLATGTIRRLLRCIRIPQRQLNTISHNKRITSQRRQRRRLPYTIENQTGPFTFKVKAKAN